MKGCTALSGGAKSVSLSNRWFARTFDRYVVFSSQSKVYESPEAVWDERRPVRTGVR